MDTINCLTHFNDPDGEIESIPGTDSFTRKSLLKTRVALEALIIGLHVLIVDVDIVFFRNSLPLVFQCTECDIYMQDDIHSGTHNYM